MSFSPTNWPATFINFIHDINSIWKELTKQRGITIDDNTNTKIIIKDIISWAKLVDSALTYMECHLKVCQANMLSLNLRKSHIFPKWFMFVGIDVCANGNRPAQSKHTLLQTWPAPKTVCGVAKFIGFVQFYSRFICNFKIQITALCKITKQEFTETVAPYWTDAAQAAQDNMKNAILSDPCIVRFDYRKLIVLRTDFSNLGFGWVLCQPGNDAATNQAVHNYREGRGFNMMTNNSTTVLHPVCFRARRSHGNEVWLHSYLDKMFTGNFAMNKCRPMLFGQ